MGNVEKAVILACAVLGTVLSGGTLYVGVAAPLKWWPFNESVAATPDGIAPMSVPIWMLIFFGLLGLALLGVALSYRFRSDPLAADRATQLTPVFKRKFSKESVSLDGHDFHNCTFTNVTFIYNGGLFNFDDCRVYEEFELKTESATVGRTIKLLAILDRFAPGKMKDFEAIPARVR